MSYRQDLAGFGEPMEDSWDGFQRINTETKSGGIIGVFRQGSPETKRLLTIKDLDASKQYRVKNTEGITIANGTGDDFQRKGFEVELANAYDGALFEFSEQ